MPPLESPTAVRALRPFAPAQDDAALVALAKSGSRPARAELYERHAQAVLARATRLLGRQQDAEDVTQEAFLRGLHELNQLRDPSAFGAWVHQIAVRLVHRRFRRQKLLAKLGFDPSPSDTTLEGLASGVAPETRVQLAEVDRVLESLPSAERLAWMLRYVEGCELGEIAAALDCSLATAKRRISAAQHHLSAWVEADFLEKDMP